MCGNEEAQPARVGYRVAGLQDEPRQVLSCKVIVAEGMEITELSTELTWNLKKSLGLDKKG